MDTTSSRTGQGRALSRFSKGIHSHSETPYSYNPGGALLGHSPAHSPATFTTWATHSFFATLKRLENSLGGIIFFVDGETAGGAG